MRGAIESDNLAKSDFLYMSIVHLLQKFSNEADRKKFLLDSSNRDPSKLVYIFMALAKSCSDYSDHSLMHRCNYVSMSLGDLRTYSDADMKSFISASISILSGAKDRISHETEVNLGVVVLDWFIGMSIQKHSLNSFDLPNDMVDPNEVREGEELWYVIDGKKDDSERVKASIVKIHRDDFPNLYFTVNVGGSSKQTVASRLKKHSIHPANKNATTTKADKKLIMWVEESIISKIVKPHF